LGRWLGTAARLLGTSGAVTLIWRADGLADVLSALTPAFGSAAVLPVYPKPNAAAIRVLVRAIKEGQAALKLLPGLLLADGNNRPSEQAEAILRGNSALPMTEN
jgi:tRNA1(Val) A37 N6-methylase TrmN6